MMEGLIAAGLLAALFVVLWAKERAARSTVENRFRSVLDAEAEKQKVLGEKATLDREIERLRTDRDRRTTEDEAFSAERRQNLATALDATRQKAEAEIAEAKRQAEQKTQAWQTEYARAQEDLRRLQAELAVLTDDAEMQSFGLYKPLYDFAKSTQYKDRLEEVREKQRAMVTNETAAVCPMQWEVSGSKVEGRKMIARQLKLMLRAFNGECDSIVSGVTWKNVVSLKERMQRTYDAVNKLGETQQCSIQPAYLKLKIEELQLGFEHAEKLNDEKEEQRALREQMREEEKAAKQLEKERAEAEGEEAKYQKALEKAQAAVKEANATERAALDEKIAKLTEMLATAHERKERAVSQAELTRSGNVYVLSGEMCLTWRSTRTS